jgi:serine/threonine-protein kinase HipA
MTTDPGSELEVFLHEEAVGKLARLPQAKLRFAYHPAWVEAQGRPLSLSLPVRPEPYEHDDCGPFFEGLLPEGDFLRAVARVFHVSAGNPFSVLAEIGGECAGAVGVAGVGAEAPGATSPPPRWLSTESLAALLDEMPKRPLLMLEQTEEDEGIRISLAGAHDKTGVLYRGDGTEGEFGLTAGRPPSTHILKLPIARVDEPIANEAYCMRLASAAGLDVADATPWLVGDHEFLLVRRYDRDGAAADGRVHQEDFCQALGFGPEIDLASFIEALIFNFLVGNHDAHAKNFSLLLEGPRAIRLAPLYDLVSTAVIAGTRKKLAMRFGGENRPGYVRRRHLDRLADELEIRGAFLDRAIGQTIEQVRASKDVARASLPTEFQDRPIIDKIDSVIEERAERLLKARGESA